MPAAATAPGPNTAYGVWITITTNSNPGNPKVTGISGKCMAQDGVTVLRRFTGMGKGQSAKEALGDVITDCPVNFIWNEQQQATNITCTGFTLDVTNPSVATEASPFSQTSYAKTNLATVPGGYVMSAQIVNGNATWDYEGTITTQAGAATPIVMSYDPELQVEDLDSGSK